MCALLAATNADFIISKGSKQSKSRLSQIFVGINTLVLEPQDLLEKNRKLDHEYSIHRWYHLMVVVLLSSITIDWRQENEINQFPFTFRCLDERFLDIILFLK